MTGTEIASLLPISLPATSAQLGRYDKKVFMCISLFGNIDWQLTANVATTFAILIAIGTLLYQMWQNSKEKSYMAFSYLCEAIDRLLVERKEVWLKIKKNILSNPKTKNEIPDKSSSYDYLELRLNQKEDFYAIEHSLIDKEIQSLCLLNQICKLALNDSNKKIILITKYSSEISFYQNNLNKLEKFRETTLKQRLLTKIHSEYINKIDVDEFYGQ